MRYQSRIDWYLALALLLAPALPAVLAIAQHRYFLLLISVLVLVLYRCLVFPLFYEVLPDAIVIHSGFLKTTIRYTDILSVRQTRNALSSPALSLDRIEIKYQPGQMVLISPQEKAAFLTELQARVPALRATHS